MSISGCCAACLASSRLHSSTLWLLTCSFWALMSGIMRLGLGSATSSGQVCTSCNRLVTCSFKVFGSTPDIASKRLTAASDLCRSDWGGGASCEVAPPPSSVLRASGFGGDVLSPPPSDARRVPHSSLSSRQSIPSSCSASVSAISSSNTSAHCM